MGNHQRKRRGLFLEAHPRPKTSTPLHIADVLKSAVAQVRHAPENHKKAEYIPSNGRKASALKLTTLYRVYVLLQHLNTQVYQGHGKFELTAKDFEFLADTLDLSPIRVERIIRQMIREGIFLYSYHSDFPYVSLVGRVALNRRLSALANQAGIPDPTEISYRKEVLELADFASLKLFASKVFNGWLRVSKLSKGMFRWCDLEGLWSRTRPALEAWIDASNIVKVYNIAKTTGYGPNPEDTHVWKSKIRGREYICWQRANTYFSEGLSKQANRGICRNAAAEMGETLSEICGESIEYIRSNWPCFELAFEARVKAYKRMTKGIDQHPDRDHYRHVGSLVSRKTGRVYQSWTYEHKAIDKELERELYLRAKSA